MSGGATSNQQPANSKQQTANTSLNTGANANGGAPTSADPADRVGQGIEVIFYDPPQQEEVPLALQRPPKPNNSGRKFHRTDQRTNRAGIPMQSTDSMRNEND